MSGLAIYLALHGVIVLAVSLIAGLLLHKAIRLDMDVSAWHLVHSGGSGRGVMLLALAPMLQWLALPRWQLSLFVWLILFFVWTSMAAMIIAAATGQRGVDWSGSATSKCVFGLYVVGAVAVFPALALLIAGLLHAL
jgi:multisubunit Na+/H+ antiporter MnhG subunit